MSKSPDPVVVRGQMPRETKQQLFALLSLSDIGFSVWLRQQAEHYIAENRGRFDSILSPEGETPYTDALKDRIESLADAELKARGL